MRLPTAREILAGRTGEAGGGLGVRSGGGFDLSRTVARGPFRGRTIEFLNEVEGTVLAVTPGSPLPQIGTEIVLGDVRARVTRVVYHYDKMTPRAQETEESNPFWPGKIVVYVKLTSN